MKWKVKEEDLKEALEKKEALSSSCFNAPNLPGVVYYLSVDFEDEDSDKVSIYLSLDLEMTRKIKATFTTSVKSASYEQKLENQIYKKWTASGTTLCTREELFKPEKKFFVAGIMEIELTGTLKSYGIKRKASESLSLAQLLWENAEDKDLTITVGNESLMVHKIILGIASPVFKAELKPVGKRPMRKKLNITDFDFETVKLGTEFCYERNIKDRLTEKNSSQLLEFAHHYEIEPLRITVQNVLAEKLSEENVVKFANISIDRNANELREYCICFLMKFVGKNTVISDIKKLNSNITDEIARRSIFSTSE